MSGLRYPKRAPRFDYSRHYRRQAASQLFVMIGLGVLAGTIIVAVVR